MAKPLLDDALWTRIEILLPQRRVATRRGGRPRVSDRAVLSGIPFILRTGMPWQLLPTKMGCGSGSTGWRRLVEWERRGVWKRIHVALLTELRHCGILDQRWMVIDSASVRATRGKKLDRTHRSPQGRVEASASDRRDRHSLGRAHHGGQCPRCHGDGTAGRGLAGHWGDARGVRGAGSTRCKAIARNGRRRGIAGPDGMALWRSSPVRSSRGSGLRAFRWVVERTYYDPDHPLAKRMTADARHSPRRTVARAKGYCGI